MDLSKNQNVQGRNPNADIPVADISVSIALKEVCLSRF
jgi:hypothetical protein